MIAAFSMAGLAGGTAVSCLVDRLPVDRAQAEFIGGLLLIVGLVTIGVGIAPICR